MDVVKKKKKKGLTESFAIKLTLKHASYRPVHSTENEKQERKTKASINTLLLNSRPPSGSEPKVIATSSSFFSHGGNRETKLSAGTNRRIGMNEFRAIAMVPEGAGHGSPHIMATIKTLNLVVNDIGA